MAYLYYKTSHKKKNFNFIAVEGDWPDCYKINKYIKQDFDEGKKASDLLQTFDRWPTWMWANWEISALTEWLQLHNQSLPKSQKAGFYGLDVYSLWESLDAIMKYLEKVDPAALKKLLKLFNVLNHIKKTALHMLMQPVLYPNCARMKYWNC
ncbi:MAG: erythromycin esterase family protein [Segetibacter sp.]